MRLIPASSLRFYGRKREETVMGLGMSEVILILVVALIVFGPRKLPELGKSLGQAMSQFRRASEDFKRTWEQEVEIEKVRKSDSQSSSTSDYSTTESNDPYNPYSSYSSDEHDSGAAQPPEPNTNSADTPDTADTAEKVGASATKTGQKEHWI
jgi:TatA/E family protein of Tat protein translocase